MKKTFSVILSLILLMSLTTGVLAAGETIDPGKEIQKQLDQGIAKGEQLAKDLVKAEVDKQVKSAQDRVESEIKGRLPQAGDNIVYIVLALLAIGVVLSIMKKLVKLAIVIVIVGALFMWAKPVLLPLLSNIKI